MFFIFQDCFDYSRSLNFYINVRILWSVSSKKFAQISNGIMLTVKINMRTTNTLIMLHLPIHEHGIIYLYLFINFCQQSFFVVFNIEVVYDFFWIYYYKFVLSCQCKL